MPVTRSILPLILAGAALVGCGSGEPATAPAIPSEPARSPSTSSVPTTSVLPATSAPGDAAPTVTDRTVTDRTVTAPTVTAPTETDPTVTDPTVPDVADVGRVVVLAEEDVLADVLALGIPVVASSATVPAVGFQGMGGIETSGIEIFDYLTISLEQLATMGADHVIAWQFVVDQVGEEALAGTGAEVHVIPAGSSGRDQIRLLGEAFDRAEVADQMIAELDRAFEAARPQLDDGCRASVVAVYAGPNVAAFAGPVWDVPRAIDELGCGLVPSADDVPVDGNGRAWISLEQLGLLAAPTLIMLQTDTVEGERSSVAEITGNPLWGQLLAVQTDDVVELDRLGYAGIEGEIRLVGDLVEILAN